MSPRRLTVVQTLPRLDAGGVERGTIEVAQALIENGHRAVVVSAGGAMVKELTDLGAEHITLPVAAKNPFTLRSAKPLRILLKELNADIIHARSRVPAWVTTFALRGMIAADRPRFITTVHGLYSVSKYSAVMTTGDAVIAVSNAARNYITNNYPKAPTDRIRVIHRGVSPDEFPHAYTPSAEWTKKWNAEFSELQGKKTITLIGRLTRLKGHTDLLPLIANLRSAGIPAHALIVGGEDPKRLAYARELRRSVQDAGLSNHITFTGQRTDIREIAATSDIVLSLSTKPESFGRTVLEALRLGTPVLGYNHGGVGEILAAVYPNGAVPLGDQAALAANAATLLNSPKQLVPPTSLFTKAEMLNATLALYEEIANVR